MLVRVVKIQCKPGKEGELRQIGREVLVPVNRDAGCLDVYFLEPSTENNNPYFGVVSMWPSLEVLKIMKGSERYLNLLQQINPLVDSLTDSLYESNQSRLFDNL